MLAEQKQHVSKIKTIAYDTDNDIIKIKTKKGKNPMKSKLLSISESKYIPSFKHAAILFIINCILTGKVIGLADKWLAMFQLGTKKEPIEYIIIAILAVWFLGIRHIRAVKRFEWKLFINLPAKVLFILLMKTPSPKTKNRDHKKTPTHPLAAIKKSGHL